MVESPGDNMKSRREVVAVLYPKMDTNPDSDRMMCPGDAFEGLPQGFDDVCPLVNNNDLEGCEKCWAAAYHGEHVKNIGWMFE